MAKSSGLAVEQELKKAHVRLMKHRLTAPYIGAIMLGESKVMDDKDCPVPTAWTDGVNKYYCRSFIENMPIDELCGLAMHENGHVFLKHIPRHMDLIYADRQLANAAFDYVINDVIMEIHEQDAQLINLPKGCLWDKKFRNWSVRQVYNFLKTGKNNQGQNEGKPKRTKKGQKGGDAQDGKGDTVTIGGKEYSLGSLDQHDESGFKGMTSSEIQEVMSKIENAIHQGGLLAGRMGLELPRAFKEAMEPDVDWADETRDFVTASTRGTDEYTFRKYNRRRVADDFFLPSTESEKVGEVIIGIDMSGSIGEKQLAEFAGELAGICEQVKPDRVRILWWDTTVHGEQIFTEDMFANIRRLLSPVGGGGTYVSCVSDYVDKNKLEADCVIVFTDGYVENPINWKITAPTLWLVTECESFTPPTGKVVKFRSKRQ